MNIKWISLIAVMAVFSAGCSDKDVNAEKGYVTDDVNTEAAVGQKSIPDSVDDIKSGVEAPTESSVSTLGSEEVDEDVKLFVKELTEDVEDADVNRIEQDIMGVIKQIEAEK